MPAKPKAVRADELELAEIASCQDWEQLTRFLNRFSSRLSERAREIDPYAEPYKSAWENLAKQVGQVGVEFKMRMTRG